MKTLKFKALIILVSIFLNRCVIDTFDMRLKVVNKTEKTIFVDLSKSGYFKSHPVLIDSIKMDTLWNYMKWVNPLDSVDNIPRSQGSWEAYINEECQDSTLTVFIFDKPLLKSTSPDSLVSNQLYSKKFSYKVKDLEKLNWRIEYK